MAKRPLGVLQEESLEGWLPGTATGAVLFTEIKSVVDTIAWARI